MLSNIPQRDFHRPEIPAGPEFYRRRVRAYTQTAPPTTPAPAKKPAPAAIRTISHTGAPSSSPGSTGEGGEGGDSTVGVGDMPTLGVAVGSGVGVGAGVAVGVAVGSGVGVAVGLGVGVAAGSGVGVGVGSGVGVGVGSGVGVGVGSGVGVAEGRGVGVAGAPTLILEAPPTRCSTFSVFFRTPEKACVPSSPEAVTVYVKLSFPTRRKLTVRPSSVTAPLDRSDPT